MKGGAHRQPVAERGERGGAPGRRGVAWIGLATAAALAVLGGCTGERAVSSELAGRVEAAASVDRSDVAFGDELTLTLEVRADPALALELPHVGAFEGFRTVDQGQSPAGGDAAARVERRWYRLRAERAGTATLPALTVRYRAPAAGAGPPPAGGDAQGVADASDGARAAGRDDGAGWSTVETTPIDVEVRSLLSAAGSSGEPPQIRDLKPLLPVERPRPWLWVALAIVTVAAAAAAVAWALRRRRVEPAAPLVPPVPAHEVALGALERLAAMELADDESLRRFYFAVSEVVRAYVEGRFGLNATDLTTEEILASLDRLALGESAAVALRSLLRDTDRVKFAKHRAERAEARGILERARGFVEDTRPVAEPPAAPEGPRQVAA
jgi:hypothetical protein